VRPDSVEVVVVWAPPDSGTVAVYYVAEWAHQQADTVRHTKVSINIPRVRTRVRVAGVDSLSRQGPWSLWSDWKPKPPEDDYEEVPST